MLKPQTHTKINVMLSILKAFKLAEILTLLNNFIAIYAISHAPVFSIKLSASIMLGLGLIVFYYAIRIRIDVALFELWDSLDMVTLDEALRALNPNHAAGRSLESRLQGSVKLIKRGLLIVFMQYLMLMLAIWMI